MFGSVKGLLVVITNLDIFLRIVDNYNYLPNSQKLLPI